MKKLFILLVVLIVVAVGGVFFAFDSLVRGGIETAGSRILQTEVTVTSVAVSPLSGNGGIRQLRVANPVGFNEPYAMELGGLDIGIDAGTVFSDVIVIDRIVIDNPVITYETRIRSDNIRTLLANIGERPSGAGSGEQASGRKVIIRDFQMLGPQVRVRSTLGAADVTIPDLRLQNIGRDNAAVTVAEATRQIIEALNRQLLAADVPNVQMLRERVDEQVQELRERAGQQADELEQQVEEQVENIRERARSLF